MSDLYVFSLRMESVIEDDIIVNAIIFLPNAYIFKEFCDFYATIIDTFADCIVRFRNCL